MRLLLSVLVILLLSSCAEFSKFKVEKDGTYRFNQYPFQVWAPNECLPDMFIYGDDRSVNFTTGRGYWMAAGEYAVQIMDIPQDIVDATSFVSVTEKFVPKYMTKDRSRISQDFVLGKHGATQVNGNPAYRAEAEAKGKAKLLATFVLQKSKITVTSLVYPTPMPKGEAFTRNITLPCYERFVKSVTEIQ